MASLEPSETPSFKSPIRQLAEHNYTEWLIDVRAYLRSKKLWEYTQSSPDPDKSAQIQAKWLHSAMEAADLMTPTISGSVKQKLKTNTFDNGFLMMNQLIEIYAPKGEAEFMRLTREYYSLKFEEYGSITAYLTKIKTLEERIRDTGVVLDDDKQTLLCLGMTLPEDLQYLTKIWSMTPDMTAEKARNMLLEEERRKKRPEGDALGAYAATRPSEKRTSSRKALEASACSKCGKNHDEKMCWALHPELAPEWLQEKWTIEKKSRKRKYEEGREGYCVEFGPEEFEPEIY